MPGSTTRLQHLRVPRAQRQRGFDQRDVELARGVGDDQHLLEERADDDDGDLGAVIDAEDGDGQRAEGRRRQIAEELDERFAQPRERAVGAAENAERHADQRGDEEAPEDDLDAVPQAFVQPAAVAALRRRGEGGVERREPLRAARADRSGLSGTPSGSGFLLLLRVRGRGIEGRLVHPHAGLEVVHRARLRDQDLRMPDKRDVAHHAPGQHRQHEREDAEHTTRLGRKRPADLKPLPPASAIASYLPMVSEPSM